VIIFDGVTKRYPGGTVAVSDLTLEVPTGEISVLVGPSGCGKTTSLRMINRMVEPTAGRVLLDGRDVREIDPPTLRRGIGYVIQHGGLFPHRRVLDNIATVPYLLGWDRWRARRRARELMERVGLDDELADRYPFQLSGGQQQRVGVARALAADPPVLLMDEPFSAVDPVVRAGLQDELLRLQAELRKTIVFVTHDIDEAIKLGDRVAVLREGGRLAQYATPAELLAAPADDFVRAFLGRDRGIRLLSFLPAAGLPLRRDLVVAEGEAAPDGAEWVVEVDADRRPLGWRPAGKRSGSRAGSTAGNGRLAGYGAYRADRDSLRAALDAALLSPCGAAIALDEQDRVAGVVTREVLDEALARAAADAHGDAVPAARRPGGGAG